MPIGYHVPYGGGPMQYGYYEQKQIPEDIDEQKRALAFGKSGEEYQQAEKKLYAGLPSEEQAAQQAAQQGAIAANQAATAMPGDLRKVLQARQVSTPEEFKTVAGFFPNLDQSKMAGWMQQYGASLPMEKQAAFPEALAVEEGLSKMRKEVAFVQKSAPLAQQLRQEELKEARRKLAEIPEGVRETYIIDPKTREVRAKTEAEINKERAKYEFESGMPKYERGKESEYTKKLVESGIAEPVAKQLTELERIEQRSVIEQAQKEAGSRALKAGLITGDTQGVATVRLPAIPVDEIVAEFSKGPETTLTEAVETWLNRAIKDPTSGVTLNTEAAYKYAFDAAVGKVRKAMQDRTEEPLARFAEGQVAEIETAYGEQGRLYRYMEQMKMRQEQETFLKQQMLQKAFKAQGKLASFDETGKVKATFRDDKDGAIMQQIWEAEPTDPGKKVAENLSIHLDALDRGIVGIPAEFAFGGVPHGHKDAGQGRMTGLKQVSLLGNETNEDNWDEVTDYFLAATAESVASQQFLMQKLMEKKQEWVKNYLAPRVGLKPDDPAFRQLALAGDLTYAEPPKKKTAAYKVWEAGTREGQLAAMQKKGIIADEIPSRLRQRYLRPDVEFSTEQMQERARLVTQLRGAEQAVKKLADTTDAKVQAQRNFAENRIALIKKQLAELGLNLDEGQK